LAKTVKNGRMETISSSGSLPGRITQIGSRPVAPAPTPTPRVSPVSRGKRIADISTWAFC
jgi:hypothetical protein